MYNRAKKQSAEEQQRFAEEAAAKALKESGGKKRPQVRLRKGHNVYMWMPSFDDQNTSPLRHLFMHYGPFHQCLRPDPVENPKRPGELIINKKFAYCERCQDSWDRYDKAGRPKFGTNHPEQRAFSKNIAKQQGVIQVIELTSFFVAGRGGISKLDKAIFKEWMEPFLKLMAEGEDGEAPEGMPEEMIEAALAGPQALILNKDTALSVKQMLDRKMVEDEEEDIPSPLMKPDQLLFQIIKKKDPDAKFQDEKGGDRYGNSYDPSFIKVGKKGGWAFPEQLIEIAEDRGINIYNPEFEFNPEDDRKEQLQAKAGSLARFNVDELAEYLQLLDFSYAPYVAKNDEDDEVDGDEPSTRKNVDNASDPDAYEEGDELEDVDASDVARLREELTEG